VSNTTKALVDLTRQIPQAGIELAELCVRAKLCASKTEARRMIKQGSVRLDNEAVKDPYARIALTEDGTQYIIIESPHD
jgi:tyrosyl-tRNA synthetase